MTTGTTDPQGGQQQDPQAASEASAREYMQQLRSTPAEQVVTEVLSLVLNAAHVKLGRRDARLLIDLTTVMMDYLRQYLSDDVVKQVDRALGQLRLGQVSAEKEAASTGKTEQNDLDRFPTPPASATPGQQAAAPTSTTSATSAASRLWIPGR